MGLLALIGLIIAYTTFSLPYAVWIMSGFFAAIPKEVDEAAMVDGCSRFGAFCRVILPLAAPGLAAATIFQSDSNPIDWAIAYIENIRVIAAGTRFVKFVFHGGHYSSTYPGTVWFDALGLDMAPRALTASEQPLMTEQWQYGYVFGGKQMGNVKFSPQTQPDRRCGNAWPVG